jgi:hypothetical protein
MFTKIATLALLSILQRESLENCSFNSSIHCCLGDDVSPIAELFGRPSPSPRTSLKSVPKISDFENPSDSDCHVVSLRIYTIKK